MWVLCGLYVLVLFTEHFNINSYPSENKYLETITKNKFLESEKMFDVIK
jgi:hypothetical protein